MSGALTRPLQNPNVKLAKRWKGNAHCVLSVREREMFDSGHGSIHQPGLQMEGTHTTSVLTYFKDRQLLVCTSIAFTFCTLNERE